MKINFNSERRSSEKWNMSEGLTASPDRELHLNIQI